MTTSLIASVGFADTPRSRVTKAHRSATWQEGGDLRNVGRGPSAETEPPKCEAFLGIFSWLPPVLLQERDLLQVLAHSSQPRPTSQALQVPKMALGAQFQAQASRAASPCCGPAHALPRHCRLPVAGELHEQHVD